MAKIFKLLLGCIALVLVGVAFAAIGGSEENVEVIKSVVVKSEGISKAEFEQIENGMTYEQVKTIIGTDGEVISESGEKGAADHIVIYEWMGEKGLGANANVTFAGDKVEIKAQFGLE